MFVDSSSIWIFVSSEHSDNLKALWKDLDKDLELEDHVASLDDFKDADFPIFVHEQITGDMIVMPPNTYHQVVNKVWIDSTSDFREMYFMYASNT